MENNMENWLEAMVWSWGFRASRIQGISRDESIYTHPPSTIDSLSNKAEGLGGNGLNYSHKGILATPTPTISAL